MAKKQELLAPEDVFEKGALEKFYDWTKRFYAASLEVKQSEAHKKEAKETIEEMMAEAGVAELGTAYGKIAMSSPSVRETLNADLILEVFAEHGIPATELQRCYKRTQVPGGVRGYWRK